MDRRPASGSAGLTWALDALGWELLASDAVATGGSVRAFWVLPNAAAPRQLVPCVPGGGAVLASYNDSMSQLARLRRAMLGRGLDVGLTARLLRLDRVVVETAPSGGAGPGVLGSLEGVVGGRVEAGVALGKEQRPNRKPVLQLLSPGRGRGLAGFAKVGWNGHTDALVDAEATALGHLHDRGPRTFTVPEVLDHGSWIGGRVLVTAPGPRRILRAAGRNASAPEVEAEIAATLPGGIVRAPLEGSPYLGELRRRLAASVRSDVDVDIDGILEAVGRRAPAGEIPFGAWHGDWGPWNMSRQGRNGRPFVWDWERYGGPVPLGFDRLHSVFQLAWGNEGLPIPVALTRAEAALRDAAGPLGVLPDSIPALARCYLLELALRFEEGIGAGMDLADSFPSAALGFLAREVAHGS